MIALQALLSGMAAGLILSLIPGPVFFGLIQTSIERGYRTAAAFALGIALCDAAYFLLAYAGLSQVADDAFIYKFMGLVGGCVLALMGIQLLLKKAKPVDMHSMVKKRGLLRSLSKGFIFNAINPAVVFYWATVASAVTAQFENQAMHVFLFGIGAIGVVFSADLTKAWGAGKIKHLITVRFMRWLNFVTGIVILAAACKLLYDALLG